MRGPQETALIDRLRVGDGAAVQQLAELYGARIFHLAFRYMKNREDAEEVVQDVLLKVYQKIGAFRGDAALSSWIYRITFNTAMSRLRNGRFTRAAELDEIVEEAGEGAGMRRHEVADWSSMADDEVFRSELRRTLARAVAELPAIYRAPVVLRDINGLSTEEAAAVLRVKDQTLKSRLHRGRMILRDRLSDFAGGLSLHRPTTLQ
jgi:RNA polymerase sigma-70 factor (ECF subfamily)